MKFYSRCLGKDCSNILFQVLLESMYIYINISFQLAYRRISSIMAPVENIAIKPKLPAL